MKRPKDFGLWFQTMTGVVVPERVIKCEHQGSYWQIKFTTDRLKGVVNLPRENGVFFSVTTGCFGTEIGGVQGQEVVQEGG